MNNNVEPIKAMMDFRSDDDFYFLQVLQRKKDAAPGLKVNGTNNNSRLIKAYYIKSIEHLDFVMPEIIQLCKIFGARAGINLNRRSFKKTSLQHLRKITEQIINGSENKAMKAYSSVVGAFNTETDKKWIIDLDGDETLLATEIHQFIDTLMPVGPKMIATLPSKNGFHFITRPFNLKDFKEKYPKIEVHKNNPTNLYIN